MDGEKNNYSIERERLHGGIEELLSELSAPHYLSLLFYLSVKNVFRMAVISPFKILSYNLVS